MKTWNGTFTDEEDFLTKAFSTSIHCDKAFWKHDILVSLAHVKMLAEAGAISQDDCDCLTVHLQELLWDIEAGRINFSAENENIHKAVVTILSDRIGNTAEKLDCQRDNAQYGSLVFRFYLKDAINELSQLLSSLKKNLLEDEDTTLYSCMLARDIDRFNDCLKRVNCVPFSGKEKVIDATDSLIDPEYLKNELGFDSICLCDKDGAGDRDFAIEFLSCASMTMMHLSQLAAHAAECQDFAFPQIVSGKAGKVCGNLFSLLTTLQSLTPSESCCLHEDKEAVINAFETLKSCLIVLTQFYK